MSDEETKPGKAWLISQVEKRRAARKGQLAQGHGICPLCGTINPFNTVASDGYTRCGHCDGTSHSVDWKQL